MTLYKVISLLAPSNSQAAVIYADPAEPRIMCTVADISDGSAGLTFVNITDIPDSFKLEIKGEQKVRSCQVAWKKGPHQMGVVFEPENAT